MIIKLILTQLAFTAFSANNQPNEGQYHALADDDPTPRCLSSVPDHKELVDILMKLSSENKDKTLVWTKDFWKHATEAGKLHSDMLMNVIEALLGLGEMDATTANTKHTVWCMFENGILSTAKCGMQKPVQSIAIVAVSIGSYMALRSEAFKDILFGTDTSLPVQLGGMATVALVRNIGGAYCPMYTTLYSGALEDAFEHGNVGASLRILYMNVFPALWSTSMKAAPDSVLRAVAHHCTTFPLGNTMAKAAEELATKATAMTPEEFQTFLEEGFKNTDLEAEFKRDFENADQAQKDQIQEWVQKFNPNNLRDQVNRLTVNENHREEYQRKLTYLMLKLGESYQACNAFAGHALPQSGSFATWIQMIYTRSLVDAYVMSMIGTLEEHLISAGKSLMNKNWAVAIPYWATISVITPIMNVANAALHEDYDALKERTVEMALSLGIEYCLLAKSENVMDNPALKAFTLMATPAISHVITTTGSRIARLGIRGARRLHNAMVTDDGAAAATNTPLLADDSTTRPFVGSVGPMGE